MERENLSKELADIKFSLDTLTHLSFEPYDIIASYIEKEANVSSTMATATTRILFKAMIMYASAIDSYILGSTSSLTDDLMIIKSISDFDLDISKNSFKNHLDILQKLGFIEKRVVKGISNIKPLADQITLAYESFKEEVKARRAKRIQKKAEVKAAIKMKNNDFEELQKDVAAIDSSKPDYKNEIDTLIKRSGYKFDDIILIRWLGKIYDTVSLIDFFTVRKYFGGKDFIMSNDEVGIIKRSKEEFNKLSWVKAKKGSKIVMALKNVRCPGTYKDFSKAPEKKESKGITLNTPYESQRNYNGIPRRLAAMYA